MSAPDDGWLRERPPFGPGWLFATTREYGRYGLGLTGQMDPAVNRAVAWWKLPALDAPGWRDPHVLAPVRSEMFLFVREGDPCVQLAYWTISGFPSNAYGGGNVAPVIHRWHELPGVPRQ